MPQNFFVTGLPKSGKTTLLRLIIEELGRMGLRVGGFISPEERHHGTRTGFYVKDIDTGRIGRLADVNADGPKVSKYHVDIKSFESVALPALKRFRNYDVIIIDEIGRMELKSQKFSDALDRVLDSKTSLIASLHADYVERYGTAGNILYLTDNNREAVYAELLEKVRAYSEMKRQARKKRAVKKERKKKAGKAPGKAKKKAMKKISEERKKKSAMSHLKDLLGF